MGGVLRILLEDQVPSVMLTSDAQKHHFPLFTHWEITLYQALRRALWRSWGPRSERGDGPHTLKREDSTTGRLSTMNNLKTGWGHCARNAFGEGTLQLTPE